MLLTKQISDSLAALKGLASPVPKTIGWSVDGGPAVEIDFTVVDLLGCAFRELRLSADELHRAPLEALNAWADQMCQKVNYLLEPVGPIEKDAEAQAVLVRSVPPTRAASSVSFYEILVKAPGVVSLRRFARDTASDERHPIDIQLTHEVLLRLVGDLVAAIPAVAA